MSQEKLTVGSLFAGIGGFDLGLESTGFFETRWFCEQDSFCTDILNKQWPGLPVYPDITELEGGQVEQVDVLCGGFPCQDLSAAGTGAGLSGSRSGLWSEYARLVGELRPRYVLIENVPPLRRLGLDRVLSDLAALGYDAEWDGISARAFGAPHQRDRLWIIAYPRGAGLQGQLRVTSDLAPELSERGGASGNREDRRSVPDANPEGPRRRIKLPPDGESPGRGFDWPAEPDLPRVDDGVPDRVHRQKALGNALVPAIPAWIGQRIAAHEGMSR